MLWNDIRVNPAECSRYPGRKPRYCVLSCVTSRAASCPPLQSVRETRFPACFDCAILNASYMYRAHPTARRSNRSLRPIHRDGNRSIARFNDDFCAIRTRTAAKALAPIDSNLHLATDFYGRETAIAIAIEVERCVKRGKGTYVYRRTIER